MYDDRVIAQNLTLVTGPVSEPITLLEAKAQCRVKHAEEDGYLDSLLRGAMAHLDGRDGILARAIMPQTWDYALPCFPVDRYIALPLAPVQTITSITYKDINGSPQTFSAPNYQLSADLEWSPRIVLAYNAAWPGTREDPSAVVIRASYGYTTVPVPLRQAILLLIAHWYENRAPVNVGNITSELPWSVRALLEPYMRTVF